MLLLRSWGHFVQYKYVKGLDNMNKFILALALVLAPFFSFAVESIFEDGTVQTKFAELKQLWSSECAASSFVIAIGNKGSLPPDSAIRDTCGPKLAAKFTDETVGGPCPTCTVESVYDSGSISVKKLHPELGYVVKAYSHAVVVLNKVDTEDYVCPPGADITYTYGSDLNGDGDVDVCSDPVLIGLVDDCKPESQDYLSRAKVTSDSVCATLPNHSVCKYDAVDVGAGQKAYALDLEGDCYDADSDLPESDYVNDSLPLPGVGENGYACEADGGLLTCSETPENVADPDTGEVPDGCGTANISFICMSGDTDSDGLPDYLDPDIDGDGLLNDDDTDPTGGGDTGGGDTGGGDTGGGDTGGGDTGGGDTGGGDTGGGTGEETEDLDLEPVVKKLDEIKKSMSETDVVLIDKPTDKAKSFYESEYEDGLEGIWLDVQSDFQSTEMMAFLNTFKHVPSGSAANGNMCFNLGSMGNFGCGELGANPIIWGAIRIFILVTAGFLCRRLVFGG
mgnify:CR=1 FL=1